MRKVPSGVCLLIGAACLASLGSAGAMPDKDFNSTLAEAQGGNALLPQDEGTVAGVDPIKKGQKPNNNNNLKEFKVVKPIEVGSPMKLRPVMGRRKTTTRQRMAKSKKSKSKGKKPGNKPYRPRPRPQPVSRPPPGDSKCFSSSDYDAIDRDIAEIKNSISNDRDRAHFLGGIVRLAAHDFMDYDRRSSRSMGADGCYDEGHPNNAGLETIWCRSCPLKLLYERRYSHLSRGDYWIASANAVIRQTSINNALDLKETFLYGRRDADMGSCRGSGGRLPEPSGCDQVEDVFVRRMGLDWREAVALLGAHTLGRGERSFSGHHGTWVENDRDAQVFDKQYYEEMFKHSWRPRNMGGRGRQDWTTGRGGDERVMLNTDMCLVYDIDQSVSRGMPCCTNTARRSECVDLDAARRQCPMLSRYSSRREAADAVREMMGGSISSNNNAPFYISFARAWRKATTVGQRGLRPLADSC